MSVLSVRHLAKTYKSRAVVKDVSLSVNSGEIVGLLGPNGAGKTTSFHMVVGLIPCDRGSIYLDRDDITHLPMDRRSRMGVGYLPQEASVFRKLTVTENIRAVLEAQQNLSQRQQDQRLENLLHEFHIGHIADNLGASLSGGERRRVEIARALATAPRFILLDEPFAGVDPISVLDIQRIIRQLCEIGIGILITDHNVRETLDICDRSYIVSDGSIIADGSSAELLQNERVRDVYLGSEFRL